MFYNIRTGLHSLTARIRRCKTRRNTALLPLFIVQSFAGTGHSEYRPGPGGTAKGSTNNNFRINIKYERLERLIC
jgi:hypothetical protein